jgi:triosephosphate isomerase
MRTKIAAGNWKMNTDLNQAQILASEVVSMANDEVPTHTQLILCVPFVHLHVVKSLIGSSPNIHLGAQNCHHKSSGAYTGEISAQMLASYGVSHVILGHSERRQYFGEDEEVLVAKLNLVLASEMHPIFCIGESLAERNQQLHFEVVKSQLEAGLFHLTQSQLTQCVLAYEPVWAIGTGVTASSEQAQEMHAFIRSLIAESYGSATAEEISILYGGSCNSSNAQELFACQDVDGGLIGGASLKSREFINVAKSF